MDLYERFFESSPDAMFIVDAGGLVVRANARAEGLFGYGREEMVGRPFGTWVPERFRPLYARRLAECGASDPRRGVVTGVELRGRRKDGTEFPAEIRLSLLESGDQCLVANSVRDLTEERRAQEKAARLAAIVDSAADGIIGKDLDGVIHSWNPGAERLFGYPAAEAIGRHISLIIPPDLRHEEAEILARIRRGENVDSYGSVRRRKDGSAVEVWLTVAPVKDAQGGVIGASKIVRDITERRQASQRVLDALRERELLLREIHHRVKNNLAVIGSLFYLQSARVEDARTTRVLRDCQDRVRSMALVHDRLYHSDDLAQVDFAEYTEELSNHLIQAHGLTPGSIRLERELEPIGLSIDQAVPCGLILNELITNALKHAFPAGHGGMITVRLAREPIGHVTFSVSDDGVGLPEEAALEARRSLGLQLVTSLARQLDAELELIRLDPGTRIRLTLPA